ncbi:cx9C motif-containing protein 4 [Pitangus sulphuratus]|nr:cx9C motif-containing protein 4 [Pitangus sulphuratus]
MAEGGAAGAPPVRLWVRRVGVYCDEHRKTWLVAAEEASVRFELPRWSWRCCSQVPPLRCRGLIVALVLLLSPQEEANNYVESKCESVLREMRKCCARYPQGRSVCCSGFEREERERQKFKVTSEGIPPPPQ